VSAVPVRAFRRLRESGALAARLAQLRFFHFLNGASREARDSIFAVASTPRRSLARPMHATLQFFSII
jgi:hypothetical protein